MGIGLAMADRPAAGAAGGVMRRPMTLADLPAGYRRLGQLEFDEFKRVMIGWPC